MKEVKPYFLKNKKWFKKITKERAKEAKIEGLEYVLKDNEDIPMKAQVSYSKYAGLGLGCVRYYDEDIKEIVTEKSDDFNDDLRRYRKLYESDFI